MNNVKGDQDEVVSQFQDKQYKIISSPKNKEYQSSVKYIEKHLSRMQEYKNKCKQEQKLKES